MKRFWIKGLLIVPAIIVNNWIHLAGIDWTWIAAFWCGLAVGFSVDMYLFADDK